MILSRRDGLGWKKTNTHTQTLKPTHCCLLCLWIVYTPEEMFCFLSSFKSSPLVDLRFGLSLHLSACKIWTIFSPTATRLYMDGVSKWLYECVLFCTHNFVTVTCCLPGIFPYSRTTLVSNPSRPEKGFGSLIITIIIEISIKCGWQTRRRVLWRDAESLMQNRV